MEVFPAPRKPVNTVIGIGEAMAGHVSWISSNSSHYEHVKSSWLDEATTRSERVIHRAYTHPSGCIRFFDGAHCWLRLSLQENCTERCRGIPWRMVSFCVSYVCEERGITSLSDSFRSIGDFYPERNIFQILIALTAGVLKMTVLKISCSLLL